MTCAEFKELAGALAIGALEPAERAACEAHLAEAREHDECAAAFANAQRAAVALAEALRPVKPPARVWTAIEKGIAKAGAEADDESDADMRPVARRGAAGATWASRLSRLAWVAAAVAIVLVVWDRRQMSSVAEDASKARGALAAMQNEHEALQAKANTQSILRLKCDEEVRTLDARVKQMEARERVVALLSEPGSVSMPLAAPAGASGGGGRATAVMNLKSGKGAVIVAGMTAQAGKDYELWVIKGTDKRAAGLVKADAAGDGVVEIDPKLLADGADALAVTLEPEGGGPAPRGPILMLATVPKG